MVIHAAGGCEKTRCGKSPLNQHNKICTDDSPETQCTLFECQNYCTDHTEFECSFFAYDEAESECYIFDGCNGQHPDEDYTTFTRSCAKGRHEGAAPDC